MKDDETSKDVGLSPLLTSPQAQQQPIRHLPPKPHLIEAYLHDMSLNELSGFPEKSYFSSTRYIVRGRTLVANQPLAQIRWPAREREEKIREDIGKSAVISETFESGNFESGKKEESILNENTSGDSTTVRVSFQQAKATTTSSSTTVGRKSSSYSANRTQS